VSLRYFPLNHGNNESGIYDSNAFFIRHDPTGKEFLFFGDVEPDSLASRKQTLLVWHAAAPKIPDVLSTIFIECSWPLSRPDSQLYGHLNPRHLADELTTLAAEVVSVRRTGQREPSSSTIPCIPRLRKRQKKNPIASEDLRGSLEGLRVYIIHCKDSMDSRPDAKPIRELILEQVRKAVEPKELGVEIFSAVQGNIISKLFLVALTGC
jgi:cAMP phosphodiesterase